MQALNAIQMTEEGKRQTPIQECIAGMAAAGHTLARSAENQYLEMMNMLTGYQRMLDQLAFEAERDGFKRYTTMYIFAVMGSPTGRAAEGEPIRNPIIAYVVVDCPYDAYAMIAAKERFNDVQGVYLYEVRGHIHDPQHHQFLREYKPVQYERWVRTWA